MKVNGIQLNSINKMAKAMRKCYPGLPRRNCFMLAKHTFKTWKWKVSVGICEGYVSDWEFRDENDV